MAKKAMTRFEHQSFSKRLGSMLKVDFRRMFTMKLFYIMSGIALVVPVLILVMTTMMDGSISVDPQTGVETVVEGFDNAWQIIGTVSGGDAEVSMDITAMCNFNLLYFGLAVLVSLFVAEDFRSGYAKNLFAVRAKKTDYVVSKTMVLTFSGAIMALLFFAGSMLGGKIAGLPFDLGTVTTANVVMCLLSKVVLAGVFVPIYLVLGVWGKAKTWKSLVGACAAGALLFMMIPMLTPLNATVMNVVLCLAGGLLFSFGLGAVSNTILKKSSLV